MGNSGLEGLEMDYVLEKWEGWDFGKTGSPGGREGEGQGSEGLEQGRPRGDSLETGKGPNFRQTNRESAAPSSRRNDT